MGEENLTVRLKKLHCYQNNEERFDDIFIIHNGSQIWPVDKRHEDVPIGTIELMVNIPNVAANKEVVLEIWDHDKLSPNDLYGHATFVPDKSGSGPYTVDMKPLDDKELARYSIDWEVL
ncbi:MAG: hypothetical protein JXR07_09080 [Reichenbachiella sp.]